MYPAQILVGPLSRLLFRHGGGVGWDQGTPSPQGGGDPGDPKNRGREEEKIAQTKPLRLAPQKRPPGLRAEGANVLEHVDGLVQGAHLVVRREGVLLQEIPGARREVRIPGGMAKYNC